jgi:RHS repeat-associated protein
MPLLLILCFTATCLPTTLLAQPIQVRSTKYCTSNDVCFPTKKLAEQAMRQRPNRDCLIATKTTINSETLEVYEYECKSRAPLYGQSIYQSANNLCPATANNFCGSEDEIAIASVQLLNPGHCILQGPNFINSYTQPFQYADQNRYNVPGGISAEFPIVLLGNDGCKPPSNWRKLVAQLQSRNSAGSCVGGVISNWENPINRLRGAKCPAGFVFSDRAQGYSENADLSLSATCEANPRINHDDVCIGPFDYITAHNVPRKGCPKTDYPCVPGTGAKELNVDVSTSGIPISLRYLSLSDVPAKSGLGPNWRHTFSRQIVNIEQALAPASTALIMVTDDQGYVTLYKQVSPGVYRDTYDSGLVLRKFASIFQINEPSGRYLSFNSLGQLFSINIPGRPADSFTLTYDAGKRLQTVVSALGRTLSFTYSTNGNMVQITLPDREIIQLTTSAVDGNLSSITMPGQTTARQYLYEDLAWPDRVTGIVDERNQRYSSYTYEANTGRVIESKLAGDVNRFQLSYPSNDVAVLKSPLGMDTTYTFNTLGAYRRMLTGTTPEGLLRNSYNGSDQLSAIVDRRNTRTEFEYADGIHETKRIDAKGLSSERIIETDWDAALNRPIERRVCSANPGHVCASGAIAPVLVSKTTMSYNARGQALTITQVDPSTPSNARVTTNSYCDVDTTVDCPKIGLLRFVDGPRTDVSDVTTYSYRTEDARDLSYRKGDLRKVKNAAEHVNEFLAYDAAGRALKMKDPNGVETWVTYHPRGWLASRTVKGAIPIFDANTYFAYTPFGAIERVTQPDGAYLHYSYDAAQRLIAVTDNNSNVIRYTLDAAGNRIKESTLDSSDSVKRLMARQYNQLSRLRASIRAPFAAQPDLDHSSVKKALYSYDPNGNLDLLTDPSIGTAAGTQTDSDYDPLNRLIKSLQDAGGINANTEYQYDALNRLITVKDPKNLNTYYTYDGLGNLISLTSPDTGVTTYTYDAAGNRVQKSDARGVQSLMTYDALNRLTKIEYLQAGSRSINDAKTVQFFYDQADSITYCNGVFSTGRLTGFSDETGRTTLCYDRRGNVQQKAQFVNGVKQAIVMSYSKADRLISIAYSSGNTVAYSHDNQGRVVGITINDVPFITEVRYLPFGPIELIRFANGKTLTKNYDQNYDIDAIMSTAAGGLNLDYNVNEVGNITQVDQSFARFNLDYDNLYRLTSVRDQNDVLIEGFSYDATGNRMSKQLGSTAAPLTYSYGAADHKLLNAGNGARSSDANGNTTAIPGTGTLGYDERNRLVASTTASAKAAGTVQATLSRQYNARGERVFTEASDFGPTRASYFLYDGAGKLLVVGGADAYDLVYLNNLTVANGVVNPIETDHLGTPRSVQDPAGSSSLWNWHLLANTATGSNAFGEQPAVSTSMRFDLRFPGQYSDGNGLYYNYFRDYEPGTGRYVESDPIGLQGGISTYGYVDSTPLRRADPRGLDGPQLDGAYLDGEQFYTVPAYRRPTPGCISVSCGWVLTILGRSTNPDTGTWTGGSFSDGVPGPGPVKNPKLAIASFLPNGYSYQCCCQVTCDDPGSLTLGVATPTTGVSAGISADRRSVCVNVFFGLSNPYSVGYTPQ